MIKASLRFMYRSTPDGTFYSLRENYDHIRRSCTWEGLARTTEEVPIIFQTYFDSHKGTHINPFEAVVGTKAMKRELELAVEEHNQRVLLNSQSSANQE